MHSGLVSWESFVACVASAEEAPGLRWRAELCEALALLPSVRAACEQETASSSDLPAAQSPPLATRVWAFTASLAARVQAGPVDTPATHDGPPPYVQRVCEGGAHSFARPHVPRLRLATPAPRACAPLCPPAAALLLPPLLLLSFRLLVHGGGRSLVRPCPACVAALAAVASLLTHPCGAQLAADAACFSWPAGEAGASTEDPPASANNDDDAAKTLLRLLCPYLASPALVSRPTRTLGRGAFSTVLAVAAPRVSPARSDALSFAIAAKVCDSPAPPPAADAARLLQRALAPAGGGLGDVSPADSAAAAACDACWRATRDAFSEVSALRVLEQSGAATRLLAVGCAPRGGAIIYTPAALCSLRAWRGRHEHAARDAGCAALRTDDARREWAPRHTAKLYATVYLSVLHLVAAVASARVAHFDVKCDNLLVFPLSGVSDADVFLPDASSFDGSSADARLPFHLKLCDFGSCSVLSHVAAGTARAAGSECVKAPEMLLAGAAVVVDAQATSNPDLSNPAPRPLDTPPRADVAGLPADVWACGCLLFELFLGSSLFERAAADDWAHFFATLTSSSLHDDTIVSPRAAASLASVHGELMAFAKALLRRSPGDRPTAAGAAALFTDLRARAWPELGRDAPPPAGVSPVRHTETIHPPKMRCGIVATAAPCAPSDEWVPDADAAEVDRVHAGLHLPSTAPARLSPCLWVAPSSADPPAWTTHVLRVGWGAPACDGRDEEGTGWTYATLPHPRRASASFPPPPEARTGAQCIPGDVAAHARAAAAAAAVARAVRLLSAALCEGEAHPQQRACVLLHAAPGAARLAGAVAFAWAVCGKGVDAEVFAALAAVGEAVPAAAPGEAELDIIRAWMSVAAPNDERTVRS